jgi:hypothetical protein
MLEGDEEPENQTGGGIMAQRGPRHSPEVFAQRGQEIYDRDVRPTLTPEDHNKFVAIDIESGAYEIDPDGLTAIDRLYDRYPDAQPFLMQVGQRSACRLGIRGLKGSAP